MADEISKLRFLQFIEPSLCLSCRFSTIAILEMANGKFRRAMHCNRLDCDNWRGELKNEASDKIHNDASNINDHKYT